MGLLLGLLFPLMLFALVLGMQRVESGLANDRTSELSDFLDTAQPDEIEAYISEGLAPALDRYWRRRRRGRFRPRRPERTP